MYSLAERLKYFRKESHMTQKQVAEAVGIKRSTYAYYETSDIRPKLETLQALSRLYNTNLDTLTGNITPVAESVLHSPDRFEKWYSDDKFNQLSDFEKAVLVRVRLLGAEDKKKLAEYLDSLLENRK